MTVLTIVAILVVIAISFYTAIYLLGRIFNARNVMQIAITNGADALFTIVLAYILILLVKDGDAGILSKSAVYFVNATVGGIDSAAGDNLTLQYQKFYNRTYNNVTNMLFDISDRLLTIGNRKIGGMTYQFSGGASDSLGALTDIAGGIEAGKEGGASIGSGLTKAVTGMIPSTSNAIGFGGAYSVAARRLTILHTHLSSLHGLLIYINELKGLLTVNAITFLIVAGAIMRILLIGKGGGSFLMAMGLSLYIILPASLLFGFALIQRAMTDLSLSWNAIPDLPEEEHIGYYYLDDYSKPMSTKALDTFKLDTNAAKTIFLIFAYVMVISLSLLAVISTSAGLSSLFGAEVGIWLIAQIGRLA